MCFQGIEDIEAIFLDISNLKFYVNPNAFKSMHNLRFLKIYSSNHGKHQGLGIYKSLESLPNELRPQSLGSPGGRPGVMLHPPSEGWRVHGGGLQPHKPVQRSPTRTRTSILRLTAARTAFVLWKKVVLEPDAVDRDRCVATDGVGREPVAARLAKHDARHQGDDLLPC